MRLFFLLFKKWDYFNPEGLNSRFFFNNWPKNIIAGLTELCAHHKFFFEKQRRMWYSSKE